MLDKHQQNDLSRDERTLALLKENLSRFNGVPRMAAALEELESGLGQIHQKSSEKETATAGKTKAKNNAESRLILIMMRVGGAVRGYASAIGDRPMYEATSFTRTDLGKLRDQELLTKARSLLKLATPIAAQLAERGIDAAALTLLETRTAEYDAALGEQMIGIPKRQGASKNVDELFKETSRLLVDEIDGMMEAMEETDPEFYSAYLNARQIKDLGLRHRPDDDSQGDQPPAPPPK